VSSLERILPFLRPIEDLLVDPSITEVMVNGGGRRIFVERHGALEAVLNRRLEVRNLSVAIKNIARACGDEISDYQPVLDARLEDGSRVAAMFSPCSVDGPTLTIRKFTHRYTLDELVTVGTLSGDLAESLQSAVAMRRNILISGGTGTGKTTLLNALAAGIPESDRIVLIEETSEILIDKPNLVRFEARRAQIPLGQEIPLPAVSIREHRHLRSPRVLCRDDQRPLTRQQVQYRIKRTARRANVRRGVHLLRHTFCSHLAMRGAPSRAIQELAGHSELSMTQRYMHLSPAALDSAIQLLDGRGNIVATATTREANSNG
jgi:hypothetical protein